MRRKAFALFLTVILMSSFLLTGCGDNDGSGYTFKYTLLSDPENLDPQMAQDNSSLNVIGNLFMGLLKLTSSGGFAEAACESYTVSSDGLKYNFIIREGVSWKTKGDFTAPMTAHDFVFAFQRVVLQETQSPYAEDFYCIKNAQAINLYDAPIEGLGVKALSDYELEIELAYANADFLYTLASTAAYPCNEEFFYQTKGKYGLEASSIASNGAFYLQSWLYDPYGKDNYLILRRNMSYNDLKTVYPYSINYFIARGDLEKKIEDFEDGDTDVLDYSLADTSLLSKFKYQAFEAVSCGLIFNPKNELFAITDVRNALVCAIGKTELTNIPKQLRVANGIIPSDISMLNKKFRELSAEKNDVGSNTSLAQLLWTSSLTQKERNSLDGTAILVPEAFEHFELLNQITAQWQAKLGFFCGVEVVNEKEYAQRIADGKYLIALALVEPQKNHPSSCFEIFTDENYSLAVEGLSDLLSDAKRAANLSEAVSIYSQAEKLVIDNYTYYPLFYQSKYFLFDKEMQDIEFNPFTGQIYFENAKKF